MVIREFTPGSNRRDLEQLLPAFLAIWNAPDNLRFLSFSLRPFAPELVRGWFEQHIAGGGRYFAALDESGTITGIIVVRTDPIGMFELFAMAVHPEAQGRGVGRQLVAYAVDVARSQGFRCVEGAVFADNARMLRLLLSLGFQPVRMEYHRRADGADLVVLRALLADEPNSAG